MAYCPTEEYGYEDSRFEKDVDENLHCSICYNVLKEPRSCMNNDHIFCLACITRHLQVNYRNQTCPECNEYLSVDTLRRPRVLNNMLSKLRINCDHANRGCPQFICLEDLKTHVANCRYAECDIVINNRAEVHQETEVCGYRKCHEFRQMQEDVGTLKENVMELDGKVVQAVTGVKKLDEKLEAVKEINKKAEASRGKIRKEIGEVKKEVKDMKDNLSKVNKDVDEVKVMMIQMLEKFDMLVLLNKRPYQTEEMLNRPKANIMIAGGYGGHSSEPGQSTEVYSSAKNGWFEVSPMNDDHEGASSFIYNDQLFVVVGGADSKAIETLNLDELPLKWTKFHGELPFPCDDHQTVVYQHRVIHIGGFQYGEQWSNMISELQLTLRCIMKKLCQMPQPRGHHCVEVFEDKILILGGCCSDNITNSVLEFDPRRNECKEMPKLPFALRRMATVRWRDEVVVLGGRDKDNQILNVVFMYHSKTGKTTSLPCMLEKRNGHCAVITENTIVVMGGRNEKREYLSSVECFTMGGSTWEYLPAMNNARSRAVAEVLPSTRKYV